MKQTDGLSMPQPQVLTPLPVEGTWPEPYEVRREEQERKLVLRTRFYEVQHDLARGGAITSIVLSQGSGRNLLLAPMASAITSATGEVYTDCGEATCSLTESDSAVQVTIETPLRAALPGGNPAATGAADLRLRSTYTYQWGYIRVRKEFIFPTAGVPVSQVLVHEWRLRPELGHYGVRPGSPPKDLTDCGECEWGRLRPGAAFDYPHRSRYVPRYVVFGDPGREGIEWFPSSDLAQWWRFAQGSPAQGEVWVGSQSSPSAAVLRVSSLLMPRQDLRRQEQLLHGTLAFDFVVGLPLLSGRAHQPFLHQSFKRNHWPSEQTIANWARAGVRTAHFHHDGDSFHDGLFWRDGSYPPFPPADMAEFDRVIDACHRHGIRVATYFSNKELHPTTEAFKAHAREWARLPDGETIVHNPFEGDEFGGQMCLRSGWLGFFKSYVDTVLSRHKLDGVYYDWNQAIYCCNAGHVAASAGNGSVAADHWDIDELIELMEWTRRRVGPQGLVIIHNTMNPCAVTENFADYVVAMEWGCGKISTALPRFEDLPLEWCFLGARSRGLILDNCVVQDVPTEVRRQSVLYCLLTGVVPWPARELTLAMYEPLSRHDLTGYRFLDCRRGAIATSHAALAAAAYDSPRRAIVIIANLAAAPAQGVVRLCREQFELTSATRYLITDLADDTTSQVGSGDLFESGWAVWLPGGSFRILLVKPFEIQEKA